MNYNIMDSNIKQILKSIIDTYFKSVQFPISNTQ